jgi:hypothetical protein
LVEEGILRGHVQVLRCRSRMPVRLQRIPGEGALMEDRPGTDVREQAEEELRESEARCQGPRPGGAE